MKDSDGHLQGCHPTLDAAHKQMAALYANEGTMHDNEPGGEQRITADDIAAAVATIGKRALVGERGPEQRAKYTADDIAAMVKNGHAMPNGSYPIEDGEDLRNAVRAVGRGGTSHDAIRRHIMKRAKALGLMDAIPDNWMADGSMMASADPPDTSIRAVPFELDQTAAQSSDGLNLQGYAAVFNSPASISDWQGEYEEVVAPGAFARSINAGTPVMMFNHGQHPVIGDMPIATIRKLKEDPHGLFVQARVFDNWMTEPLRQAITSDPPAIDGMSIRFSVPDGKETWDRTRNPELRTINEAKLYELGPVVFPAYKDTTVALRSLASHLPGFEFTYEQSEAERRESELRTTVADLVEETLQRRLTLPTLGTPVEPVTDTSEGPAEDHDPDSDHSWDQQRAVWMAAHFPTEGT